MYKLIRFYNQNRKTIFRIILIIVFVFGIIQLLNYLSKLNMQKDIKQSTLNTENSNSINKELISNESLISGTGVSSTKLKKDVSIINEFIDYCNKKDVDSAYKLLANECKEEMFPSIDDFYNIYYSKIFDSNKKIYTIENWNGNIYQVRFSEDILATGNLNDSETKQDYITIVKEDGESKLNINSYIGRTKKNRITEIKDIKVTVTAVETYMDYEIYKLSIENNSEQDILLDTSDSTKSVYLLDGNNMKYYFYNNEIIENRLLVKSKFKNEIQIKFSNSYSSSRKIEDLVFSKLVLNYDEYKDNESDYNFFEFRVDV